MLAEIFQGERDAADVFFLCAVILFGVAALFALVPAAASRAALAPPIVSLGLTALAFGLLLL